MRIYFLCILLSAFVTGCAYEPVKPWHRDLLAPKRAQLISNELKATADEHIYFSKEGSSGGQGVGGGGCGCN